MEVRQKHQTILALPRRQNFLLVTSNPCLSRLHLLYRFEAIFRNAKIIDSYFEVRKAFGHVRLAAV